MVDRRPTEPPEVKGLLATLTVFDLLIVRGLPGLCKSNYKTSLEHIILLILQNKLLLSALGVCILGCALAGLTFIF